MKNAESTRNKVKEVIQREALRLAKKHWWVPKSVASDLYGSGLAVGAEVGVNAVLSLIDLTDEQMAQLLYDVKFFYQLEFT